MLVKKERVNTAEDRTNSEEASVQIVPAFGVGEDRGT